MTKTLRIISLLLVVLTCVAMLASCGIGSYEKKLEKAGYDVEVTTKDDLKEINEDADGYKVKAQLVATKGINYVTITKFASTKQAKEQAQDLAENGASLFGVLEIEQKGAYVFYGTEDGVKAALGK